MALPMNAFIVTTILVTASPTFTDPLYDGCPAADPSVEVGGKELEGVLLPAGTTLLPPSRSQRIACLMETCDVDRQEKTKLLNGPSQPVWWLGWTAALALGSVLGMVGLQLWHWLQ